MALDGYILKGLVMELEDKLLNSRIEKIYQPQSNLLVFNMRTKTGKEKLVVSADPSGPRINLTGETFSNPEHPPVFCMLLRKHLQSGTVNFIQQQGLDRIVELGIKAYDELGVISTKYLVCEIMGRHSNIILLDENRIVIDAIRRVTAEISSYRNIIPKIKYKTPPQQDKINLLESNPEPIKHRLTKYLNKNAEKAIITVLEGISLPLAREMCYRSSIHPDSPIKAQELDKLTNTIMDFKEKLLSRQFNPYIYFRDTSAVEFSPVKFNHLDLPHQLQDSINSTVDNFFTTKINAFKVEHTKNVLIKHVKSFYEKNGRKLQVRLQEYQKAGNYEKYRLYGELLTANLYRLNENTEKITLENFYDPDLKQVEVKLNPYISPSENAQRFFKIYNKKKRVIKNLSKQIQKTKDEIEYLESLLYNIEKCTDYAELVEIKKELLKGEYIKPSNKKKKEKASPPSSPLHFVSADGFDIYVGKNNYQNDYLTLKFASKNDLWLHTKNIPGSHVIIKSEGRKIPDTTLDEAALLAAYYSKGKHSGNVPVDYTYVKHVSKPSGAKPGMVIYRENKTLFVTPEKEIIDEIQKQK